MAVDREQDLGKGEMVDQGVRREQAGKVLVLNPENWEDFKGSPKAVLVIQTTWCGCCRAYEPCLPHLAQAFSDVRFGRVVLDRTNAGFRQKLRDDLGRDDSGRDLMEQGFPNTIALKGGKVVGIFWGTRLWRWLVRR